MQNTNNIDNSNYSPSLSTGGGKGGGSLLPERKGRGESLLIIRFSALGDVAMLVPVVHALATQYPDTHITVLSRPFARALFENIAPNVSFMGADVKKDYKGITGLNALYRRLTAKKFTHIADMHGVLRTHYLRFRFLLANYKVAHINKHRKEKQRLCAVKNKVSEQLPTSFDNYMDVLRELGFDVKPTFRSIFGEGKGNLRQLPDILPLGLGEKKSFQTWIGIAPFATHEGKIYPVEKMEQVVKRLVEKHPNGRIFLFHGKGHEQQLMHEWEERYGQQVISASSLLGSLDKELILMSHLNVMVSMDSSNMHLASLVACPVVSVWGATHRYAGFLGWNQSPDNCVEHNLACRPCSVYGNKPCIYGDYRCINDITPDEIVSKIATVISH